MSAHGADQELLWRLYGFTVDVDRSAVGRVEPTEGGSLLLTPDLPLVWSANYLLFDDASLGAKRMAEMCEELLGGAGLDHREVRILNGPVTEALGEDFKGIGWDVERYLFMVHRGEPDRPAPDGVRVERGEVPDGLRRGLRIDDEFLQDQGHPVEEIADQLVEWEKRQDRDFGGGWFSAGVEGEPLASTCRLLTGQGLAQVEDVATLSSYRGRGLARAAVLAACDAARADGAETVFIVADGDDWTAKLYERLGFEPLGTILAFQKLPGAA